MPHSTHLERYLSWNINVKQVNLAMHRNQVACAQKAQQGSYSSIMHQTYLEGYRRYKCCTTCRPGDLSRGWTLSQFQRGQISRGGSQHLPPISHVFVSFAAAESIFTLSLSLLSGLNCFPGVYPILSAYVGKCVTPYGELKHSYQLVYLNQTQRQDGGTYR